MEIGGPPFDPLSEAEHKDSLAFQGLEGGSRNLGSSVLSLDPVLMVCLWDSHHTIMGDLMDSETLVGPV